jgi:chromosome segregation ATPase
MMEWIANIPPSIMLILNGFLLAVLGVYFSRKKDKAEMTTKNIEGAQIVWDEYEKRIQRLEQDAVLSQKAAELSKQEERKLSARVSSLEHNDKENQTWIQSLETQYALLKKEHYELRDKYAKLRTMYDARLKKGGQGE